MTYSGPPVPQAPPAPQPPPIVPHVLPIPVQAIQPAHVPQLNWSHFKPEFTGKQEKMQRHIFLE